MNTVDRNENTGTVVPQTVQQTLTNSEAKSANAGNTDTIGYLVDGDWPAPWEMSDDDETTDVTGQDSPIPYRPSEVPVSPDALREGGVL